jgi:hypothetical protein
MVAAEQPQQEQQNLTVQQPMTPQETAVNALQWLWDVLHDDQGNPLVEGAGFAITDIHQAFQNVLGQLDNEQRINAGLVAVAEELRFQRDEAQSKIPAPNSAHRMTVIITEEIAHKLGYEMLGEYSNEVAEDLLNILTGDEDGLISQFTRNKIKEALEEAAEEICDQYDGHMSYGYGGDNDDE